MAHEEIIEGIISDSRVKKKTDPTSFSQWIIENKKYFLFLFSIVPIVITTLWNLIYKENWQLALFRDPKHIICITAAIQCLFILFAIFLPVKEKRFRVRNYNEKNKDSTSEREINANKALVQFKNAWTFVWASWFLLYATLFIKYLPTSSRYPDISTLRGFLSALSSFFSNLFDFFFNPYGYLYDVFNGKGLLQDHDAMLQFFLNLFNNCATVAFIICYLIFSRFTVGKSPPEKQKVSLIKGIAIGILGVILLGIFEFLLPIKEITIFLSSISAGIIMAFFIGMLNNKYINPSMFVIVCLYTYMAIQTLFPFWEEGNEFIVLLSTNLAFIFKIVFYLFILWLFRSGKLLFYFVKVRALHETVEKHWNSFKDNVPFKKTSGNESSDD